MKENNTNEVINGQVTQSNNSVQYNEQVTIKEPKKGNGLIIGLLIILVMGLVGYIIYDKLIKKDDSPKKTEPTSTPAVTPSPTNVPENTPEPANNDVEKKEMTKSQIPNKNISIEINGETINVKRVGKDLYFNDVKVYTTDLDNFTGFSIYSNKESKYALIEVDNESVCGDDTGFIDVAIDSQGKHVEVETKSVDGHEHDLIACGLEVYIKGDKIYGTRYGSDDETEFSYEVEYIIK